MSYTNVAYTHTVDNEKGDIIEDVETTSSKTVLPRGHLIRWTIFFAIESGFIVLAFFCLFHPLPVGLSRFQAETVKSGFTTIFIVWHSIASLSASGIISDSFSREWSVSRLGVTDRVSTITSGWWDQILYSFTTGPTGTFRMAFLTSALLFALAHLGPSTITASTNVLVEITPLNIGNLIMSESSATFSIARMEQVFKVNTGYITPPNWIISRPTFIPSSSDVYEYTSDLIHYQHTCQFTMPSIDPSTLDATINGVRMFPLSLGDPIGGSNMTHYPTNNIKSTFPYDETESSFAILLFGGNSTIPLDPTGFVPNIIDLSGLPTLYNPNGYTFQSEDAPLYTAPLVTAIWCDSRPELTTGVIRLSSNELTVLEHGFSTRVGNIDPQTVPQVLALGLSDIFSTEDPEQSSEPPWDFIHFSTVAAKVVLSEPAAGGWISSRVKPLDATIIAKNMDALTLSVSKAMTGGLSEPSVVNPGDGLGDTSGVSPTTQVFAKRRRADLGLATSKPYLIVTIALFIILAALLMILVALVQKQQRPSFKLKNIRSQ